MLASPPLSSIGNPKPPPPPERVAANTVVSLGRLRHGNVQSAAVSLCGELAVETAPVAAGNGRASGCVSARAPAGRVFPKRTPDEESGAEICDWLDAASQGSCWYLTSPFRAHL